MPAVTHTQELAIYNATFYNEQEKDGYFALVGTTEDKSIEFAISLLGNTEEDVPGVYFTSLYFLVDGTVVVSKKDGKLCFELNAVNSYDIPVHIIYDESKTTDVHDTMVESVGYKKILQDGHLLIQHNGSTYNILGSRLSPLTSHLSPIAYRQ